MSIKVEQRVATALVEPEQYDRWAAKYDPLRPRHAAAVEEMKAVFEECLPRMLKALAEAAAVDDEVANLMATKPYDLWQTNRDGRSLPKVEMAARGLESVAQGYSVMRDMKLPVWFKPGKVAWPPPQPMMPIPIDPRYLQPYDWLKEQEAFAARVRAAGEAQAKQIEARKREEKDAYEAAQRRGRYGT